MVGAEPVSSVRAGNVLDLTVDAVVRGVADELVVMLVACEHPIASTVCDKDIRLESESHFGNGD